MERPARRFAGQRERWQPGQLPRYEIARR